MPSKKATQSPEYLSPDTEPDLSLYSYFAGIDPSYSSTGLIVLDSLSDTPLVAKTIRAGNPHETFYKRISCLLSGLAMNLEQFERERLFIIMEGAAFASEFGAFKLGKLSGVIEYWLANGKYSYRLTAPSYVKKVATGNGGASKQLVMSGVKAKWGFESVSSDLCDAYAMAQIARGARFIPQDKKKQTRKITGRGN